MRRFISALVLFLVACGGGAPALTGQTVLDRFKSAGLEVENVREHERDTTVPIPNSYTDWYEFTIPSAGQMESGKGRGAQVFTCDTKQNCDAIYAFFDAAKALAGPYLYQSADGRVVLQMNGELTPDVAAKYQAALD